MRLDPDTLAVTAAARLSGGPILQAVLDPARGRLYALQALSPHQRGIAVLDAGDLSRLAVAAGTLHNPLQRAGRLALTADGRLLVREGDDLYLISPDDFSLLRLQAP